MTAVDATTMQTVNGRFDTVEAARKVSGAAAVRILNRRADRVGPESQKRGLGRDVGSGKALECAFSDIKIGTDSEIGAAPFEGPESGRSVRVEMQVAPRRFFQSKRVRGIAIGRVQPAGSDAHAARRGEVFGKRAAADIAAADEYNAFDARPVNALKLSQLKAEAQEMRPQQSQQRS